MKRIVLCGSRTFKDYIIQIGYKLIEEGYEVVIPKEFFVPMPKREHSMLHFSEIQNERTDYVLVINEEKNSFAEIAMGFYFGKTVFLKNDIYEPFADELVGWGVIPLKGNLDAIKEYK